MEYGQYYLGHYVSAGGDGLDVGICVPVDGSWAQYLVVR